MAKKTKHKSGQLTSRSVLADRFVPRAQADIHLAPVLARWHVHGEGGGFNPDGSPAPAVDAMTPVIASMAENFIPRVPCLCGRTPAEPLHGPIYYAPAKTHVMGPPGE